MKQRKFIDGVEQLVRPLQVGGVMFFSNISRQLPLVFQRRAIARSQHDYPLMGFIVEPYSYFLFHKIANTTQAQQLLGKGYTLTKTKIFEDDDTEEYYVIIGCFNVRSNAFIGTRIEMYVPAESNESGMCTWVIVDYATSANSMEPRFGLVEPNAPNAFLTTTYDGQLRVRAETNDGAHFISNADLGNSTPKQLDQRLWLEGNLSIDYGSLLREGDAKPFSLRFDVGEVQTARELPLESIELDIAHWHNELYEPHPNRALYFPFAQHFISSSYPDGNIIKNEEELREAYRQLGDLSAVQTFSVDKMARNGLRMIMITNTLLLLAIVYGAYSLLT